MARAAVNQGFQVGAESTRGTAVAASKKLPAYSLKAQAAVETSQFTPMGYYVPTVSQLVSESTSAEYSGLIDYNNIVYPLSSLFGAATVTQPDAIDATTAYQWAWTMTGKEIVTPQTYTTEFGDATRAASFTYGTFNSLELDISRTGDNTASGEMLGQRLTLGASLTGSPSEVAVEPVDADHWDVSFATSGSGLTSPTQLTAVYKANLSFGDIFAPEWALNSSNASFSSLVQNEGPKAEWKMTLAADSTSETLLSTYARDSKPIFMRLKATGESLGGAVTYGITIDFCALVTDIDSFDSENGIYVMPVNMALAYDKTWAKYLKVTVVNTVAAL